MTLAIRLGWPLLAAAIATQAIAAPIDDWRTRAGQIRIQMESDAPGAYQSAQQLQADLPSNATAADRVKVLNLLARSELYLALTHQAGKHAAEALALAKRSNDQVGRIEADLNIAMNTVNQGRIDAMVEAVKDGMDALGDTQRVDLRAEMLLRASMMYRRLGQFEQSVTLAMQTLDIAQRSDNPLALAYAEQGMAISYTQSGRPEEASVHFQRMREAALAAHSTVLEADALLGLGTTTEKGRDIAEAEHEIESAIALYRRVGGPFYVAHALFELANIYARNGDSVRALPLLDEDVRIYEEYDNIIGLWWTLNTRSWVQQGMGRLSAARADAEWAYALANKLGITIYLAGSNERLSKVAAEEGDYKRAYELSAKAAELTAKAESEKTSERITTLAQRYQDESKQRQIEELTRLSKQQEMQQRWLWTLIVGSAVILLGSFMFMLRLRKSREEIRALNIGLEQRVQDKTAELRQQTSYLRTLIDTLPVSVWLKDTQRRYQAINSSSASIDGLSSEAVLGKTDEELWPGEIGQTLRATDLEVMATRKRVNMELIIPDSNGVPLWHEIDKAPVLDEDGTLLGIVGVGRDINERKSMEDALRESRQMMAEAQRIAHVGSWELDLQTNVLKWSEEIYRIFEVDPERFGASYEAFMDAVHPDDREKVDRIYAASLESREPYDIEHRLQFADGRIKHVHERCETYYSAGGEPLRSLGTVQDITERKLMEAALNESEARYRNNYNLLKGILESTTEITFFALDRQYRYLAFNTAHRRDAKFLWGAEPELGKNWLEGLHTANTEEHREFCKRGFDRVLAGEAFSIESTEKVVMADGQVLDQHFDNFGSPIWNEDGEVIGLTVFSVNITERKRMAAELAARERELSALAESSPGMMGSYHQRPDGTVCMPYVSPNIFDLYGLHPEDVAEDATPLMKLNHPDDVQGVKESIAESARTMTPWRHQFRILHPTKGLRWMEGHTNPLPHPDGGIVWYGYVHDITELKHTEAAREAALAEARRLAHARSEFLAQMSHELRTPLNGILGYAQILGHDKHLNEKQHAEVSVIRQSGEHLLTLINDILDFARSEAGRIELHPGDVPTDKLLQTIVGIVRVKAEEKGLGFVTTFAFDLPGWLRVDEKRLRQVLLNLLSNAVKFTDRGQVGLRVDCAPSGRLRFEVSDSGIGIAADQMETIFRPFEQVGDQRYRFGGAGLGLSISRELVRLMGGDIQVESTPGKGSVFSFEIESGAEAARASAMQPERAIVGYSGERKTVLIVDDQAENRTVAKDMLMPLGFDILEAEDGQDALDKTIAGHPDLILMDVAMPGMDGLEATRRLRKMPGLENLPIVVLSASVSIEDQADCMAAGASAFLPKPLELDELLTRIGNLLHLELQYESAAGASVTAGLPVPPPADEIETLHLLAEMGDMRGIMQHADALAETDVRYTPFIEQLRDLARSYQSRAMLAFIRQYRDSRMA